MASRYKRVLVNGKLVEAHRVIAGTPEGMDTDHIDGNKRNNDPSNLRVCTRSQNMMNRGRQSNNTSGYKGVSWRKDCGKWRAAIQVDRRRIHLGLFDNPEDAATAYNLAAADYHGEFAYYNKPLED